MVNFMMAVNRYCSDCMKEGQFLPLHFVMVNIHSGMWMCPKTECIFPMNSHLMKDYMEEDLTTEKVLQLTKKGRRRSKGELKNTLEVTKERLSSFHNTSTSTSRTSENSFRSSSTNITSKYSSTVSVDDSVSTTSSCSSSKQTFYPLWENTNLLCWLDAALAMIVLNSSMDKILADEQCLIGHLFTEYKKILISYNTFFDYNSVQKQMDRLRNNILKFLQPKLLANYSDEDSPLVCLPLVLRTSKLLSEALEMSYTCMFKCESCGFERSDGFKKIVMSLPNTGADLDFNNNIYFYRCCYKCFSDHQKTKYMIDKYPSVMFVHFPQGVQTKKYWVDFNFETQDGEHYVVTQIIQYLNKKRHFILWSYDYQEKLWCEADDLKEPVVRHRYKRPRCRPHDVHLIIWERLSFLQSLPPKDKSTVDELISPTSPSTPALSILVSPDALPSEVSRFDSRESSTRTSLSSSDNVSSCGRTFLSHTPLRSVKDVKGLRNTPRYEPYISRKFRKETNKRHLGDESSDTSKGESSTNTLASPAEAKEGNINTDTMSTLGIEETKTCGSTDAKSSGKDSVSFDFLKGVLSEGLKNISEDLLLNPLGEKSPKEGSSQETSSVIDEGSQETCESKKSNITSEESLHDLYALFGD